VALNAAEEETIESLKRWWDDNGTLVITLVAAAALLWGGWTFWQNSRQAEISGASDLYEEILDLAPSEPGIALGDAERARIMGLAEQLQSEYGSSTYARFGALFAAQQAVNAGDLDAAARHLQWVVDDVESGLFSRADQGLMLTATLRLGRVLQAQGELDRALALVDSVDPGTFEADFAELRGDIYLAQGRTADARDAYTTALESAGGGRNFLQMKLDELSNES
jgi:predicted negative regulator of RcsB-dependent stress response